MLQKFYTNYENHESTRFWARLLAMLAVCITVGTLFRMNLDTIVLVVGVCPLLSLLSFESFAKFVKNVLKNVFAIALLVALFLLTWGAWSVFLGIFGLEVSWFQAIVLNLFVSLLITK